ncbi:MAG: MazG nucleotide pyrophosphohydrolase domain-containing protein [bacterium]|nr:MazG nucleotide pyrophosphohydrolase domain-containing protein [bacterium]
MTIKEATYRAMQVRQKYIELQEKRFGSKWSNQEIYQGLVGDIGDLGKLIMAKEGRRTEPNSDEELAHELSDCLYCLFVLANNYNIDLEKSFLDTMGKLENRVSAELTK